MGHPEDRWQLYGCCNVIFAVAALILSVVFTIRCNMVVFTSTNAAPPIERHFGLWWYSRLMSEWVDLRDISGVLIEQCWSYTRTINIDAKWIAARTFNILAIVCGCLWTMIDFLRTCAHGRVNPEPVWMGYLLLGTCFFSGMTLIALDSNMCKYDELSHLGEMEGYVFNDHCEMSSGAILVITATVLWFVASLCSLAAIRSKNEYDNSEGSDPMEPLIREGP